MKEKLRKTVVIAGLTIAAITFTIASRFWLFHIIVGACLYLECALLRGGLFERVASSIAETLDIPISLSNIVLAVSAVLFWPLWIVAIVLKWWR